MRRVMDILCGVVIGVGIFGLYVCFVEKWDELFYMIVILCGVFMTMIKFD